MTPKPASNSQVGLGCGILSAIGIVTAIVATIATSGSTSSPPDPIDRMATVSMAAPCGKTAGDAYEAYAAISRSDMPALAGLAEKGNFVTLETGVTVHAFSSSGKLSLVSVTSGRHVTETCWIATTFLQ